MINSTSTSNRAAHTEPVAPAPPKTTVRSPGTDNFSAANSAALDASLARQPEIRPEVVERGRRLAADPAYPSADIIAQVSEKILQAPDLTTDQA